MKRSVLWIILAVISSFFACDSGKNTIEVKEKSIYFNTDAYMQTCIAKINEQPVRIQKKVQYNQTVDEQTFSSDAILWENEFVLFKNLSIHKNALMGMYQVDSLVRADKVTTTYQLLPEFDQKSATKKLIVYAQNSECIGIDGVYFVENLLYKTNYELRWREGVFYEIKGERKIRFSKRVTNFLILGKFEF